MPVTVPPMTVRGWRPGSSPIRCPSCEGVRVTVGRVLPDPENPVEPTVIRLRTCQDCGHQYAHAETEIDIEEARARLRTVNAEKMQDRRVDERFGLGDALNRLASGRRAGVESPAN